MSPSRWVWRHLLSLVGALVIFGGLLLDGLTYAEHAEFISEHFPFVREFAVTALAYLQHPPGWLLIVIVVLGLILIWAEGQIRRSRIDYTHALKVEVMASYDASNIRNKLEVRLGLKNTIDHPIRFIVDSIETELNGNLVITKDKEAVIARNDQMVFYPSGGIGEAAYRLLPARPTGTMELLIRYGHPDSNPSRKLDMQMALELIPKKKPNGRVDYYTTMATIKYQKEKPL